MRGFCQALKSLNEAFRYFTSLYIVMSYHCTMPIIINILFGLVLLYIQLGLVFIFISSTEVLVPSDKENAKIRFEVFW